VTTGTAGGNSQSGDITVSSAIGKTAGGDATLLLKARNNIAVNANISSTSNKLNLTLWADSDNSGAGGITMTNAAITSNGGNVTLGGGADPTANPAIGTADIGVNLNNGDISAGAGNISIRGRGEAAGGNNFGVYVYNGSVLQTTTGNIGLTGTGGDGTNRDNYGVYVVDAGTAISVVDGDISITGTGGDGTGTDFGVFVSDNAAVISTGTGAGAGNIAVTGDGGDSAARQQLRRRN